ncbi:kelch-like protein 24 [Glandiceps talaboti]
MSRSAKNHTSSSERPVKNRKVDHNRPSLNQDFQRRDFLSSVWTEMNAYRKEAQFTDVVLMVGGREFPCHKIVLVSGSDYFKGMFSPGMVEHQRGKVSISGIEVQAMAVLLDYLYTGNVSITNMNVQALLETANLLLVCSLKDSCIEFMLDHIDASNCLGIWQILDSLGLREYERARNYALEYFQLVSCYDEFLELTKDKLIELLLNDGLCVDREQFLYDAVMKWFQHDKEFRTCHLADVLDLVKIESMESDYLLERIEKDVSPINWELSISIMDKVIAGEVCDKRKSSVIAIVGGSPGPGQGQSNRYQSYLNDKSIYFFDPVNITWTHLAQAQQFDIDDDVILSDNRIIVPRGRRLTAFDLDSKTWSDLPICGLVGDCFASYYIKWTIYRGKLYILGGDEDGFFLEEYDEIDNLSQERFLCYDLSTKALIPVTSPAKCVIINASVLFRNKLYIFGYEGSRNKPRSVMQCYDIKTNVWAEPVEIPNDVPVTDVKAVVLDRYVYVFQNATRLYIYDPIDGEWLSSISGAESHRGFISCGATVCNCKLFIMGGYIEDTGIHTDQIYCYDPSEETVREVGKLKQPMASPKCVTISKPPWYR